jgi:hypothetical protein
MAPGSRTGKGRYFFTRLLTLGVHMAHLAESASRLEHARQNALYERVFQVPPQGPFCSRFMMADALRLACVVLPFRARFRLGRVCAADTRSQGRR